MIIARNGCITHEGYSWVPQTWPYVCEDCLDESEVTLINILVEQREEVEELRRGLETEKQHTEGLEERIARLEELLGG